MALSDDLHVFGSRPFRSLTYFEGDALSLPEVLEPHTLDRRHVEEQVRPCSGLDEPETLIRQSLNRSFGHVAPPFNVGHARIDRKQKDSSETRVASVARRATLVRPYSI